MPFALLGLLLLASTDVVATSNVTAPAAQPAQGGAVAEKGKEPKKICRRPDTTGSRLSSGKKVCMTAEQWRKAEASGN